MMYYKARIIYLLSELYAYGLYKRDQILDPTRFSVVSQFENKYSVMVDTLRLCLRGG